MYRESFHSKHKNNVINKSIINIPSKNKWTHEIKQNKYITYF